MPDDASQREPEVHLEQSSPRVARVGLISGIVLAVAAFHVGPPLGLSRDATWVFALLAVMATWWVTLAIDPAVTGLLPLFALAVLGIGKPAEITAPYANDVIFLFGGGSLLAHALDRTGVSPRFASALVRLAGTSPLRVLGALMVATTLLSAFVSNTASAATMLPLAVALGDRALHGTTTDDGRAAAGRFATSLLLGVAFSSSIGGALTPVGSPPNPIGVEWLAKNGVQMDFARWLRFSVPATAVFLPIAVLVLGVWLFPTRGLTVPRAEESQQRIDRDGWSTVAIFALAVGAWVTQPLYARSLPAMKDGTIAVGASLLLFVAPSVRREGGILDGAAFTKVPWRVLVLFGGGLSLADAMQRTGLSASLSRVIKGAGALPSIALLALLVSVLVFASEIASNTALAAMAVPIVGAMAPGLGVRPETLVIPAVFAASWAFALPVGTPPNALVFATGGVRTQDMMRAGLVLDVVAIVVIVVMARLLL
ncbi:MAG: SLC13/DASS family transporter [Deltaproteobacteria bacterium]|nr:SLC13/DASS family transporter [Deltaproteobacteria bacterium]